MVTIPSALIGAVIRLARSNRTFVSADQARRHARKLELRPASYGSPARLTPMTLRRGVGLQKLGAVPASIVLT